MNLERRNPDRLYELLPALYRIADASHHGELRALLGLITSQADALHEDTHQLWDDFFIETCRRWVIPYIGDLVGNTPLHDLDLAAAAVTAEKLFLSHGIEPLVGPDLRPPNAIRLRADVAKTIHYRRRKGTPPMLEGLARDVTGWEARFVEFFTTLDWYQHLEHVRLDCHGCPDLRRVDVGDRCGGPWDSTMHTVDVRRIDALEGWHNIPNVGFFLWRLGAFPATKLTPRAIGGTTWRLTFSPLGQDMPLFSGGLRAPSESTMATEVTVEAPIRPAAFFEDLKRNHSDPALPLNSDYYGADDDSSLVVFENGLAIPAPKVECANLGDWGSFGQPADGIVRIDVTRGRLAVPTQLAGKTITVSYFHGFSAALGGGEYKRSKWLAKIDPGLSPILVSGGGSALESAIASRPPAARSVFRVTDNASYELAAPIVLAAGESLVIEAIDEKRPHVELVNGSLDVQSSGADASLTLGSLLVEGGLRIAGDLARLRLLHTTLVPGRSVEQEATSPPTGPSLIVEAGIPGTLLNTGLEVEIAFSILGAVRMPSHATKLWVLDSIVQGIERPGGPVVDAVSDAAGASGPPAHIERSTLFGASRFLKLDMASESIFTDVVMVEQRQQGCVRFSFVPRGSRTPQQYRCQPALQIAIEKQQKEDESKKTGIPLAPGWDVVIENAVGTWLVPAFETTNYGRPSFSQFQLTCPVQIRTGAEDGSEMGVFCVLKQPQREANLRLRMDEYLPVGLEAGIIYVT